MKRILILGFCLTFSGMYISCDKQSPEPNLTPKSLSLTGAAPAAIQSSNEFGIELFKKVSEGDSDSG